jgi:hypothetical protein
MPRASLSSGAEVCVHRGDAVLLGGPGDALAVQRAHGVSGRGRDPVVLGGLPVCCLG